MQFKKLFLLSALATFITSNSYGQTVKNANVALGNLSTNLYFDSYDDNTKTVKNLNFTALCDGSNSAEITEAFTIKVYIWDGSNPTFVKTYNNDGLYHFGAKEYANQDIDLSGLQLAAGTYRLGVFVDADNAIPNPPDDPTDNAYLTQGNIVFTPKSGNNSITAKQSIFSSVSVFPNPATEQINVKWDATEKLDLVTIANMNGQIVKQITFSNNQNLTTINTTDLPIGIYTLTMHSAAIISVQRFSIVTNK
ncbi:MAG: T9SS type A sorting domain-containing protein [Bacteroidota bacterium]|nr:T9SS type A sorting domain-containing protein [Bacteroidota bacterium]